LESAATGLAAIAIAADRQTTSTTVPTVQVFTIRPLLSCNDGLLCCFRKYRCQAKSKPADGGKSGTPGIIVRPLLDATGSPGGYLRSLLHKRLPKNPSFPHSAATALPSLRNGEKKVVTGWI
jgi:hypothetical protein